jgi:putative ABC transport system ATP-binding protein
MNSHNTMTSHAHSRDPLFRTEHLSKLYTDGQVHAVEDVSLGVRRGEYVAIMGPSGSGKSTLLNLLGALDRPTSGEVYFDGEPYSQIRDLDRLRAEKFGFVFQSFHLLPILTAVENVQVPMFEGSLPASSRTKKARELLELVGMGHRAKHMPQKLSVGERQRVAIARSLANDPTVLLADEPTGNLDSVAAEGIFELFAHLHHEQGMTIVLITHDEEFGLRAQRTVRMQDGRVNSDIVSERRRIRTPLPPFAV